MKRLLLLCVGLLAAMTLHASDASDSLAMQRAKRTKLKLKGAVGYTMNVKVGHYRQQITMITLSPGAFSARLVLSNELTPTSFSGERLSAEFGVNAGFWSRGEIPSTYIRIDGEEQSETLGFQHTRVNGVVELDDDAFDISECAPSRYKELKSKTILASGPLLIDDGRMFDYRHKTEGKDAHPGVVRFYNGRHPRTVIGRNANGDIVLMVVDGRFEGVSEGLTIAELAKVCRWLGMVDALNLDGGGSTTMWTRYEGVVNHPCDNRTFDHEGERAVLSSILFLRRR